MKSIVKFLVFIVLFSCASTGPALAVTPKMAKLNFRLDRTLVVDNTAFDRELTLQFDLYLERPDLKLKEPKQRKFGKMKYTVDLPLAIQPKLMYVSEVDDKDPESGRLCDRPRFPHRCEVNIQKPEDGAKPVYKYLIKVTFEDGAYAEKEIIVPFTGFLDGPKLVAPTTLPNQGDKLNIQFKDVGAKEYEVSANLCKPYNNDGINPCLDGVLYCLKRRSGKFVVLYQEGLAKAKISTKDGIVTLKADFPLNFETSVEYAVKAVSYTTKTYFESNDYKTFER